MYCYFKRDEHLKAISQANEFISNNIDGDMNDYKYFIAYNYFKLSNYTMVRNHLNKINNTLGNDLKAKTAILKCASYLHELEWSKAKKSLMEISNSSKYRDLKFSLVDMSEQGEKIKYKNPTTAGLLSIIPGLGYWYADYKQTAVSAFLVNNLFFIATYQAFKKKNSEKVY